ncbi:ATP-binding protein [Candidatus Palauibacter sp.]|uniref:ATP-binding protein n=1 Tax=Candidatus Palauibacter sp. TaxID=3101350 RepID=UPI003B592BEC
MIHRRVLHDIERALGRQAAVALLGVRQAGKTTLALDIARRTDAIYLDLQTRPDRAKLSDPRLFLEQHEDRLVILDEVHRVPELFSELRGLIDRGRRHGRRTGRFLVLGSAAVELLRQAGESLAGRIEFVSLTPLDVLEVAADRRAAISLWVRGGLPDSFLASSDDDSFAFRTNFIRTYLERDVAEFVPSRLPTETLGRLWTMLAHWQGGLLRASELARSLAINTATVGRYIDSLTSLFILRRLPPFVANVRKRLVKSPKIYVRDSGLVHALLRIGDFDTLAGHPVSGASWEGFVIENLLAAAPPGSGASFYRTAAGAEMDLVLELPGCAKPWAFEIKRGLAPRPSRGLRSALEDLRPERTFVVYGGEERYPLRPGVEAIGVRPMAELLAGLRAPAPDGG